MTGYNESHSLSFYPPPQGIFTQCFKDNQADLLTCTDYWGHSLQLVYPSWTFLEASCLVSISKCYALESTHAGANPIPSAISAAREGW